MRQLIHSEYNQVSGAGIISDDPKVQDILGAFGEAVDEIAGKSPPMIGLGLNNGKNVVNGAVSVIDAALTSAFNNIWKLFG